MTGDPLDLEQDHWLCVLGIVPYPAPPLAERVPLLMAAALSDSYSTGTRASVLNYLAKVGATSEELGRPILDWLHGAFPGALGNPWHAAPVGEAYNTITVSEWYMRRYSKGPKTPSHSTRAADTGIGCVLMVSGLLLPTVSAYVVFLIVAGAFGPTLGLIVCVLLWPLAAYGFLRVFGLAPKRILK